MRGLFLVLVAVPLAAAAGACLYAAVDVAQPDAPVSVERSAGSIPLCEMQKLLRPQEYEYWLFRMKPYVFFPCSQLPLTRPV